MSQGKKKQPKSKKPKGVLKGKLPVSPDSPKQKATRFVEEETKKRTAEGELKSDEIPEKVPEGGGEKGGENENGATDTDATMGEAANNGVNNGEADYKDHDENQAQRMFNARWLTYLIEILITVEKNEKCFPVVHEALIQAVAAIEKTHGSEVNIARLRKAKKVIPPSALPTEWHKFRQYAEIIQNKAMIAKKAGAKGTKIGTVINLASKEQISHDTLVDAAIELGIKSDCEIEVNIKKWQCVQGKPKWLIYFTSDIIPNNIHKVVEYATKSGYILMMCERGHLKPNVEIRAAGMTSRATSIETTLLSPMAWDQRSARCSILLPIIRRCLLFTLTSFSKM